MKKLVLIVVTLISFTLSAQTKPAKRDFVKEGFVKATVIKYEVESCGFMLQLSDGKKLQVSGGIAKEFQKNKRKVWVKYKKPKTQPMTTCMAGEVVEVMEMVRR